MAKSSDLEREHGTARYEFRVWGRQPKARRLLARIADDVSTETVDDCYFLVDGPAVNAKIRNDTLKLKRLVGTKRGFQRWVSKRHKSVETLPPPFDELFDDLNLDRVRRGKSYDLERAVSELDPETAAKAVFVTKHRTIYRVGSMSAEVTDITVTSTGDVLHTLAIDGHDLDDLEALRKRLGLKNTENVAVHVAISDES